MLLNRSKISFALFFACSYWFGGFEGGVAIAQSPPAVGSIAAKNEARQPLDKLIENEAWTEAVRILRDTPTPKRDQKWQHNTEKVVIGLLRQELDDGRRAEMLRGFIREFPHLDNSVPVAQARPLYDFRDNEKCFAGIGSKSAHECDVDLQASVRASGIDKTAPVAAAELVLRFEQNVFAAEYFAIALRRGNSAVCQHAQLLTVVKAGLAEPSGIARQRAEAIVGNYCWSALKDEVCAYWRSQKAIPTHFQARCPRSSR